MALRPVLCAVQDAEDFNDIPADAVNSQEGEGRQNQFAGVLPAAWAATMGIPRQGSHAFVDRQGYTSSRSGGVMVPNVITNAGEIAGRRFRPANVH
jgi:hypothetical protein